MSDSNRYPEHLLHWIWQKLYFDIQHLQTVKGDSLQIYDVGKHNYSDGPDFLNACLQIGDLRWHGDIEIHWNEQDWNAHNHHKNINFNQVVLHVVYDPVTKISAVRRDGTSIPTLCLKPHIPGPLRSFLEKLNQPETLPCSQQFSYISDDVFYQQLEKAHKEYFEQKVHDLMAFFNPSLPVSAAWRSMVALAIFDGLGISHNREPMQQTGKRLIDSLPHITSSKKLVAKALELAGFGKDSGLQKLKWKHKGCRPNNHPRIRLQQAAEYLWHITNAPFENWLNNDIREQWDALSAQLIVSSPPGRERKEILYGTVWLPSIFILGNLLHAKNLKSGAYEEWKIHRAAIPNSLLTPLKSLRLSRKKYRSMLGSIYQLRTYCKPKNCQSCKVFKKLISA